ncbi:MarR family winged helix-turn-helix transcriptional regulator [Sphingomonas hengshuiensis]|uniref:MarR family winged helix-turn-helix transcriptional regulator n=1 Tax=Sphingomonas hengshuiensis TaxID=1609977 RepID=UPI0006987D0D|nr:MarR family transcriptional regulator [Sphingomonas hengshuiensis]
MKKRETTAADRAIEALEERWANVAPGNLPYHILLLSKIIDRTTAQHVRETADLSLPEWRTMAHVHYLGLCSASEVASLAFVDRAEVSRALGSLEERGLVRREPHPTKRNSRLVSLTDEGKKVHLSIRGERGRFFTDWVSDLDEAERKQLDSGLRQIIRRVVTLAPHVMDL